MFESELSGLLLNINPEFTYISARGVYSQYKRDHYDEVDTISVLPIPSCRYTKAEDKVHVIPQVERVLTDIRNQITSNLV